MTKQELLDKLDAVQHTLEAFLACENDPEAKATLAKVIDDLAAVSREITQIVPDD